MATQLRAHQLWKLEVSSSVYLLVLPTCGRCHRGQLGKDRIDGDGANPNENIAPEDARRTTVEQTGGRNLEYTFPGHQNSTRL
jgi:hypothetical protein